MATVRETFDLDARTLTLHDDVTTTVEQGSIECVRRVHADFAAGTRYVSFFVPESELWVVGSRQCLVNAVATADLFRTAATFQMGHASLRVAPLDAGDLPFSGRCYVYIDLEISDEDVAAIIAHGRELGLMVDVRDRRYIRELDELEKPEAFISHDGRDKDEVARPLALALGSLGVRVWFDEFSLRVGDSLRKSIDKGLKDCSSCVLVISPSLIENRGWAEREFDSISQREISEGRQFILPVWHNVSRTDVEDLALWLPDRYAANTASGIDEIAKSLRRSIVSRSEA